MPFIKYLYTLESGSVCIYPDYDNKIKNRDLFPETITLELNTLLQTYGTDRSKFIILIDLTKVKMNCEQASSNLLFYKNLKIHLENKFPDKLEQIIIYDYTHQTFFLLSIIKLICGKELRDKIIMDRNYKQFMNSKIISNINVNNNGLHC
tara:strand:+ start:528 stop:977 length:450 start_codon:yes stop_codon:yes gene_type:complete